MTLALALASVPAPSTATLQAIAQAQVLDGRAVRVHGVVSSPAWPFDGWIGYEVDGLDPDNVTRTIWMRRGGRELQPGDEVQLQGRLHVIRHRFGFIELRERGVLVSR